MPFDTSTHKVLFDGDNKLIIIKNGITNIKFKEDIYYIWKDWILEGENFNYLSAIKTIGGDSIPNRFTIDISFIMLNGWKIKPYLGQYDLKIVGNVFTEDGSNLFEPADVLPGIDNNINIELELSAITRVMEAIGENQDIEEILTILSNPLTVNIADPQMDKINEILYKVTEMWKIHGLSSDPLTVNQNERKVSTIEQTFTKSGGDVIVNRIS